MDTSESPTNSETPTTSVLAPSTSVPSVIIALHPLVIMNVSEHWTRVRSQAGKPCKGLSPSIKTNPRFLQQFKISLRILVYGALLGRQKGRNTELCTSFEMKMDPSPEDSSIEDIDLEFLNTNIAQCNIY